jgi:hypothetical protein
MWNGENNILIFHSSTRAPRFDSLFIQPASFYSRPPPLPPPPTAAPLANFFPLADSVASRAFEEPSESRSNELEYASHSCRVELELIECFKPREIRPVIFTLLRQRRPFFPPTTIVSLLSAETP